MVQKKNSKFSKKKQKTKTVWFEKSFTRDLHTYTPLIYTEIYLVDLFLLLLQIPDDLFSFFNYSVPIRQIYYYYFIILLLLLLLLLCLPRWSFVSPPTTTTTTNKTPNEFSVKTFFYFSSSVLWLLITMFRDRHSAVARSRRKAQKDFSIFNLTFSSPPTHHHLILNLQFYLQNLFRKTIDETKSLNTFFPSRFRPYPTTPTHNYNKLLK